MSLTAISSLNSTSDAIHLTHDGKRTLCGRDCAAWAKHDQLPDPGTAWLCERCNKAMTMKDRAFLRDETRKRRA